MLAEHDPAATAGRDEGRQRRLCLYRDLSWPGGPSKLLDTVRIHSGPGTTVPQVAAAGAEGMGTFYSYVIGIEGVGISTLHAVPLEGFQVKLAHRRITVIRVEDVYVGRAKSGTLPPTLRPSL